MGFYLNTNETYLIAYLFYLFRWNDEVQAR